MPTVCHYIELKVHVDAQAWKLKPFDTRWAIWRAPAAP